MKDNLADILAQLRSTQRTPLVPLEVQECRVLYQPHTLESAIQDKKNAMASFQDLIKRRARKSVERRTAAISELHPPAQEIREAELNVANEHNRLLHTEQSYEGLSKQQPRNEFYCQSHPEPYPQYNSCPQLRTESYPQPKYEPNPQPRTESYPQPRYESYEQPCYEAYPYLRPDSYYKSTAAFNSFRGNTEAVQSINEFSIVSPVKARSFVDPVTSRNLQTAEDEWASEDFPWTFKLRQLNFEVFGNKEFRSNQREVINAVLSSRDVFVVMPTGGGKSLTFQLPAILSSGLTLVVMPLISLIEDQTVLLTKLGISVRVFSGTQSAAIQQQVYDEIRMDASVKMLFITPEKLAKSDKLNHFLNELYYANRLERIVIDEAHCVSKWGRDFRSDYLKLCSFRKTYPKVPIIALTATATDKVKEDIVKVMGMNHALIFLSSFNRPNLIYEIRNKDKGISEEIAQFIKTKYPTSSGLVYCISKKDCERLAKMLKRNYGIKAKFYHADLKPEKRSAYQAEWMEGRVKVLVATVAFGMGIDKRDVRYVIHYSLPKSLENYYQESGRAGRDGKVSDCILFYNYGDKHKQEFFIHNSKSGGRQEENFHELNSIIAYCEDRFHCRRQLTLKHFGEEFDPKDCNRTCDNCKAGRVGEATDFTAEARTVLSIFDGPRMGLNTLNQIVGFFKGLAVKSEAQRESGLYGAFKHLSKDEIERVMSKLVIEDALREKSVKSFKNIYSTVIELGPNANRVRNGSLPIVVMIEKNPNPVRVSTTEPRPVGQSFLKSTVPPHAPPYVHRSAVQAPSVPSSYVPSVKPEIQNRMQQLERLSYNAQPVPQPSILSDELREELHERLLLVRRRLSRKLFKSEAEILTDVQVAEICCVLPTSAAQMCGLLPEVYTEVKHFLEVNELVQPTPSKKSYFNDFSINFDSIDLNTLASHKRPTPPCRSEPPLKIAKLLN
jgi:RecQ family ATP-dependent DNA helicase